MQSVLDALNAISVEARKKFPKLKEAAEVSTSQFEMDTCSVFFLFSFFFASLHVSLCIKFCFV
jgi:hypothetical protein